MNRIRSERGFTIIEVIVAMIVLTVGILALGSTSALVTRMIARANRAAQAASFAAQRMEILRPQGCIARTNGSDTLYHGSQWIAYNTWTWSTLPIRTGNGGNAAYGMRIVSVFKGAVNKLRTDTLETEVLCGT
ncbi:MAG TPA: prepilin-type N-terminal cleavage/methylation domain-containing protein [Gemmatimonadales bacterium]|nr:prepilin-type N-terminal cleavage/methylation domain-containing protein [Gemmatimonadales bacterium]